ncbi:FKBP-type peptidyl-prolyl cis-trans isomerase [Pantoea sp. SGAir0175]
MKVLLTRMMLVLMLSISYSMAWAKPALTGYDSSNTIPYSLFDDSDNDKPWIQSAPVKKKTLRPATPNSLQEMQRIEALQRSLNEQQRINKEVLAGHQSEKLVLEAQITALKSEGTMAEELRDEVRHLKQALSSARSEHAKAASQIAELTTVMQGQRLLTDSNTIQYNSLKEQLNEKEQSIVLLTKQLDELKATHHQRAVESSVADITQQKKIDALQQALVLAQQHKANAEEQLNKLKSARSTAKPESHQQKLSYANGVAFADNIVNSLRAQQDLGIEPDRSMVLAGIQDAFDRKILMNSEEVSMLVSELDTKLNEKLTAQQQEFIKQEEEQRELGKKLIAKTLKRKGVKKLDGALYVVTKIGSGKKIMPASTVNILITGRLADGTVFDNSGLEKKVQRSNVKNLLPTITKILSQLSEGTKVEIVLPPEQAFGQKGVTGLIPAGATLQFDVEILND